MKKFTISMLTAIFCGLAVLSACTGTKNPSKKNSPSGYLMPTASTNDYCGEFTGGRVSYGYLMPEKKLFLLMRNDGGGAYGINIYTYIMENDNIICTPGHFVNITPRGGDKIEITSRKSSTNNTPSFVFVPTPNCENSDYVATETVADSYFYLCGNSEACRQVENLFEDERYAEFKELVDNYGK